MITHLLSILIIYLIHSGDLEFKNLIQHFTILKEIEIYKDISLDHNNYLTDDQVATINGMLSAIGDTTHIEGGLMGPWFVKGGFGLIVGFTKNRYYTYQFLVSQKMSAIQGDTDIRVLNKTIEPEGYIEESLFFNTEDGIKIIVYIQVYSEDGYPIYVKTKEELFFPSLNE